MSRKMSGSGAEEGGAFQGEMEAHLKRVFEELPHDIPLYVFTDQSANSPYDQAAVQIAGAFAQISQKIQVHNHDIKDPKAQEWGIEATPTILFDPDRYDIRYWGAPFGEEGRFFLAVLVLVGLRMSKLSDESALALEKIDSPRRIKIFVSPTCPYCPDQALNAVKTAIEKPELISVDIIDIQCHPEIAGRYSAFSVPQAFANEVLIAQGAQPEELFVVSLAKLEQQTLFIPESDAEEVQTDVVIVGGGPAGLSAGIYTVRSGLGTAVIEKGPLGGQVATTPIVENYPGFTRVAGKSLVDILVSHALEYVQIFQGEEVLEIKPGEPLEVKTNRRRFLARAVILATGANYRHLGAMGEDRLAGRGVSYCATCDGALFKGKRVVVVGGGNSAVTEALHLKNLGVDVTMVHRRDSFRAQEHLTRNIEANGIPVLWSTEIKEIRGKERVTELLLLNNKTGATSILETDGVFVAIGYDPTTALAARCGVEITADGFIAHDSHHRTNIPGIYSAGDVEGGYKQIVTAMAQGTEAALSVYEDLLHPYWKAEDVQR